MALLRVSCWAFRNEYMISKCGLACVRCAAISFLNHAENELVTRGAFVCDGFAFISIHRGALAISNNLQSRGNFNP